MKSNYLTFFEEIDKSFGKRFGAILLNFKIIGYIALALAGLPERGTKDADALLERPTTTVIDSSLFTEIQNFLNTEFGKGSPISIRYNMYLDVVPEQIPWLPPYPNFIPEKSFSHISIFRLHPVDTCVSKTFSNFKRPHDRASDRKDILNALDNRIITFSEYVQRLDKTFPKYEIHAEAPDVFPRVLRFINDEMRPLYGNEVSLTYTLPNWMENLLGL